MSYIDTEVQSASTHSKQSGADTDLEEPPTKKIKILQNILLNPQPSTSKFQQPLEALGEKEQFPYLTKQVVQTQTPQTLSLHSPRKEKWHQKNLQLRVENRLLKEEIIKLQNEQGTPNPKQFEALCDLFLTKDFAKFVKVQLQLTDRSIQGRRYSNKFKEFCLTLYFLGPRCYKQLMKTMCLPSPRGLRRFIEKVRITPGYNSLIFELLKLKVDLLKPADKTCIICIDEVSIKQNLFYHWGIDTVIGLEDDGINKTSLPATSAATIMIRGLRTNWKQAVGYI